MASDWNLFSDAAFRGLAMAELEMKAGIAPRPDDADGLVRRLRSASRSEIRPSALWRGYLTFLVVHRYLEVDVADLVCHLLSDTSCLEIETLPRTWLRRMRVLIGLYGDNWRVGYATHR